MKNNLPIVSIIIPAYNSEDFIDRCLNSVISQTYSDIEILIIDDASSDHTFSICERFRISDSRIRTFRQKKSGVSAARNLGLSKVTGKYCCFVDADDTLSPDFISTLVQAQINSQAELVYCDVVRVDTSGNELGTFVFQNADRHYNHSKKLLKFILNDYLNFKIGFAVWNKLYLTQYIQDYSLRFCESASVAEDLGFNLAYLMHCTHIHGIDSTLYYYCEHEDSLSASDRGMELFLDDYNNVLYHLYCHIKAFSDLSYFYKHFYMISSITMNNQYRKNVYSTAKKNLHTIHNQSFFKAQIIQTIYHPLRLTYILGPHKAWFFWKQNIKLLF